VQAELEQAVIFLCRRAHEATKADGICISGGVGLNSVANGRILRETRFRRLFVTPAAGDSGIAVGAALYGHHDLVGSGAKWRTYDNFHGKRYSVEAIGAAIDHRRAFIRWERLEDMAGAAARDIAKGRFVAWFEGGSEFGPRALGHRSIVCDPRPVDMRDRLNAFVKFREPFRPYAASVLSEHAQQWFDLIAPDPFMMTVARLLAGRAPLVPSVCHVDGSCRIQTVDPCYPGRYRKLIESFFQLSAVPLVLNTSFNIRGEPIVETHDDALCCFLGSNLDVLYLEDHRIVKVEALGDIAFDDLVPCLNDSVRMESQVWSREGAALEPRYYCRMRTGYRAPLTQQQYDVLRSIDGRRTVDELRRLLTTDASSDPIPEEVRGLRLNGVLSLKAPWLEAGS
jgi:carbamoyltransferase